MNSQLLTLSFCFVFCPHQKSPNSQRCPHMWLFQKNQQETGIFLLLLCPRPWRGLCTASQTELQVKVTPLQTTWRGRIWVFYVKMHFLPAQNIPLCNFTVQITSHNPHFHACGHHSLLISRRSFLCDVNAVAWLLCILPSSSSGEEGLRPQAPVKPQRNRKAMSYDAGTVRVFWCRHHIAPFSRC